MEQKPVPDTHQIILIQGIIPSWAVPCIEKMCNVRVINMRENKKARFAVEIYREDTATKATEHERYEYFETLEAAQKFADNFNGWRDKQMPDINFSSILHAKVCL